jgi:YVTN family beta-propeller protein
MKRFASTTVRLATATLISALLIPAVSVRGDDEDRPSSSSAPVYCSPVALAISPDGKTLYVADRTAGGVKIVELTSGQKRGEVALSGSPYDLALSPDGGRLYVPERGAGTVAVIDPAELSVTSRISVGRWPVAVLATSDRLYVGNQDCHTVSVIDLTATPARPLAEIPVIREPRAIATTPDERSIVVTNFLARGVTTDAQLAAEVSIIDSASLKVRASVPLPPGSTAAAGVCVSPDGRWAYVVHQLSRFSLPVTQLERGWVNTYALSVIDLEQGARLVSMLLDDLYQGAANPSAVVCSKDGGTLWISHAGVHEVSIINVGLVHRLLVGQVPSDLADLKDGSRPNIWVRIQQDPDLTEELANDLTALYIAGAIQRVSSGGNGPQDLILTPDQQKLLVANYYSAEVAILNPADGELRGEIDLGPQPEPDAARRGEIVFHDATRAFQRWHSCASCHPNDGRVDGLRWDFLRDGIGNPKDTPSLVYVDKTEPLNRLALREDAREGARTGMLVSHMVVPTEEQVEDLLAYMVSLRPDPNPRRIDGQLSPAAQRGEAIFEGKAGCARCHPAPYYTDNKSYDIGIHTTTDPRHDYDTPTLIEAFRTAPYLHDGRALTIRDVLTTHNPEDRHGSTKSLSEPELDDLVEYVLSL